MNTRNLVIAALMVILALAEAPLAQASCTTAREYITALEYLRARQEFKFPESEAQKLARQVAAGCTGAAQRFIRVTGILSQGGLGSLDSVQKGLEFAQRTDRETEAFVSVFRRAFLEDQLDLDLRSSLRMADQLSREFEGDALAIREDFEKLVDFCANRSRLDLPKPQCGAFAARLAKLGQSFGGGVSDSFVRVFEFMRSDKGPGLPAGRALELSEKLIIAGPDGPENFMTAYRYAVSPKGLSMSEQPALGFALEIGTAKEPVPSR